MTNLLLAFFMYAFLGWLVESVYCSVPAKHWINRGFLNGPFCPIYACGALALVGILTPLESYPWANNLVVLYVCSVVITSTLEYITGYLLETIFKTKWWDYSKNKCNIKGRVCLKNSLLFGLLAVFLLRVLHPFVMKMIGYIPFWLVIVLDVAFVAYFAWDITVTLRAILHMNNNLERLQTAYTNLKTEFEEKVAELEEKVAELELRSGKYEKEYLREKAQEKQAEFRRKLAEKVQLALSKNTGRSERHLVKAFPTMKSHRYTNALEEVKKAILSLKRY